MMSSKLISLALAAGAFAALGAGPVSAGPTVDKVKAAGVVTCGVSTGLAGFSMSDQQGNYTGLDVDTCRAVAAAVLGDGKKVKFVPTTAQQRFTALQSGEIDVLTGTRRRHWPAKPISDSILLRSPTMTARVSWWRRSSM
jgi:general L-amino acid transport system substrate-binding protein